MKQIENQDYNDSMPWLLLVFCSESESEVSYQDLHLLHNMAERTEIQMH